MTMRWQGGALVLTNPAGATVFNSDEGLFHCDAVFTGTLSLAAWEVYSQYVGGEQVGSVVDSDQVTVIAAVNANCTHVIGSIRTEWAGSPHELDGWWRDISGSHIEAWAAIDTTLNPTTSTPRVNQHMGSMELHTFFIEGSQLKFRQQIKAREKTAPTNIPGTLVRSRPAVTVHYRLMTGFFV